MMEGRRSISTTSVESDPSLLYRSHNSLNIGDVHRFVITYFPPEDINHNESLFIKIKNVEMLPLRAAYLAGPYILYCDIRTDDYDHTKDCFITADQPVYDSNISAGQSLTAELSIHTIKEKYVWIVDVMSQMLFSTSAEVHFEVMIAKHKSSLHRHNFGDQFGKFTTQLDIQHLTTIDLWNKPPPSPIPNAPVHLVVITHGLHSNVTADMFYLKEQIEAMAANTGDNIVVRGYSGNVCKTERGVKYLGRRLAESIVRDIVPGLNINKISFISHSLGGLVTTFALAYINFNYPEFFENIEPENFIAMATPFLGISNENPAYVKMALGFGIVGKTGHDLGLQGIKPLLMLLPSEPTRKILRRFKRRTLYANAVHDGIVPLRTSALLYLDWKALSSVYAALKDNNTLNTQISQEAEGTVADNSDQVSEIPANVEETDNDDSIMTSIKSKILSPLQTAMAFCVPNLQDSPNKTKKYNRYQTSDGLEESHDDDLENYIHPLPKSSVIESIKKVLLPPSPPLRFLTQPESRPEVILHDKIYNPDCIPKTLGRTSNSMLESLDPTKRQRALEERIAKRWHNGMTWRKVLVNLLPDAHNNIIVRRRFSNAYGWLVVDHMVQNHFGEKSFKGEDVANYAWDYTPATVSKSAATEVELDREDAEAMLADVKLSNILTQQHRKASKEFGSISPSEASWSKKTSATASIIQTKIPRPQEAKETKSNINKAYMGTQTTNKNIVHIEITPKDENTTANNSTTNLEPDADEDDEDGDDELNNWINDIDSAEVYDGPTGMINTVTETMNEGMEVFRKTIFRESEENLNLTTITNNRNKNNGDSESKTNIHVLKVSHSIEEGYEGDKTVDMDLRENNGVLDLSYM